MKVVEVISCYKAPNGTMMVDAMVRCGIWPFRKTKRTTLYKCDHMTYWWREEGSERYAIDTGLCQYWWKMMGCDSGSIEHYLRTYVKR